MDEGLTSTKILQRSLRALNVTKGLCEFQVGVCLEWSCSTWIPKDLIRLLSGSSKVTLTISLQINVVATCDWSSKSAIAKVKF